jgi:hypothetical protein
VRKLRSSALTIGETLSLNFAAGLDIGYGGKRTLHL